MQRVHDLRAAMVQFDGRRNNNNNNTTSTTNTNNTTTVKSTTNNNNNSDNNDDDVSTTATPTSNWLGLGLLYGGPGPSPSIDAVERVQAATAERQRLVDWTALR